MFSNGSSFLYAISFYFFLRPGVDSNKYSFVPFEKPFFHLLLMSSRVKAGSTFMIHPEWLCFTKHIDRCLK
jgi:hypothetical protein